MLEGPKEDVGTMALGRDPGENRWALQCFWLGELGISRNRADPISVLHPEPNLHTRLQGAHCMAGEGQVSSQDHEVQPGSC